MNMYLVQRHTDLRDEEYDDDKRLTELYHLDYMGAAEFEFGAYAKIVRKINEHLDDLVLRTITMNDGGKDIDVHFFYSPKLIAELRSDVEELLNTMVRYNNGEYISFKEHSGFYERKRQGRDKFCTKYVAWTDIRHGIFFTADHLTLEQYKTLIVNSVKYYDEMIERNKQK